MRRMFCKNQRSRAIECLLTESHIHGNMYVWFGGRHGETSHRNMVWRPVSSLHRRNSDTRYFIELRPIGKSGQMGAGKTSGGDDSAVPCPVLQRDRIKCLPWQQFSGKATEPDFPFPAGILGKTVLAD